MHTQIQLKNFRPSSTVTRIGIKFEPVKPQRAEIMALKSVGMAGENGSFFHAPSLPERGVPFSPLND